MKIIVISSDPERARIAEWLGTRGYTVAPVDTAAEAAAAIGNGGGTRPIVLADLGSKGEGLRFLRNLVKEELHAWPIAIADRRDAGATSEAIRLGVVDVLRRPVREDELFAALGNAREFAGLASRQPLPVDEPPEGTVFTNSPRMREIYDVARRVAPSRCPVLLVGESGTGRETVARAIHMNSPLREVEFVRKHAGALDEKSLASLLSAGPRVLYIENIGELSRAGQYALEAWLLDEARRGSQPASKGVRLLVASRPRIDMLVAHGDFRRPLLEALAVVRLDLPALRERPQDIPLLAVHFLKQACLRYDLPPKMFSRACITLLAGLPWRGNASELRALCERLAVLVPRGLVLIEDVLQHLRLEDVQARGAGGGTLREARHQFEREFIASALQRHQWRMEVTARELGIERTNLYRKMKQLAIVRGDSRV